VDPKPNPDGSEIICELGSGSKSSSVSKNSVSDPDPVGSAFNLVLDPGSAFGVRIRIQDPDI
jgi:hypothetical protein